MTSTTVVIVVGGIFLIIVVSAIAHRIGEMIGQAVVKLVFSPVGIVLGSLALLAWYFGLF